jgi:hypothetical protein
MIFLRTVFRLGEPAGLLVIIATNGDPKLFTSEHDFM